MAKDKNKKDFTSLAAELKKVRNQPPSREKIERFNKIVEKDEQQEPSEEGRYRKIASPNNSEAAN